MISAGSASLLSPLSPRIKELAKLTHDNDPEITKYIFMIWGSLTDMVAENSLYEV